jgi:molybdate transport system substrate-binding protein
MGRYLSSRNNFRSKRSKILLQWVKFRIDVCCWTEWVLAAKKEKAMRRIHFALCCCLWCGGLFAKPEAQHAPRLTICAAMTLKPVILDIAAAYQKKFPAAELVFSFGSSGVIAQQILAGAPADLLFSVSKQHMRPLAQKKLIVEESLLPLARQSLVVVASQKNPCSASTPDQISRCSKIAIGLPESVASGWYGRQCLEKQKLWSKLKSHFVFTQNVEQSAAYAVTGEVNAAVIFKSDYLLHQKKLFSLFALPQSCHDPVEVVGAVVAQRPHQEQARQFLAFVVSYLTPEKLSALGLDPPSPSAKPAQ